MHIPRILITAPKSGAGKTLVTCGILQVLKSRGMKTAAFKCGPDYIDPMFHREVLGIPSYNLDTFLCGKEGVRSLLVKNAKNAEIAVLEGVMGYYDGLAGVSTEGSAYDITDTTDTPAILVVDCKGASVSVVPYIQGFLHYREQKDEKCHHNSHIAGVILNRLSPMMYGRMKRMIEEETGIKVLGYVPVMKDLVLESRHLGLKMPGEVDALQSRIAELGKKLEETIDIDRVLEIAGGAGELTPGVVGGMDCSYQNLRIGIAKDEAFCFMYQDNLDLITSMGAKLIPFSPLSDEHLPEGLDGLLLYGGYPELYADRLSKNESMRMEIRRAVANGLPCIAECGGFMYLQESITDEEEYTYPMVGALKGKSYYTPSLRRFGYITLSGGAKADDMTQDGVKPDATMGSGKVFGREVGEIPAHEFHYYDSDECGSAFTAKKPLSQRNWKCIISTETLLAGYPHIHYYGNLNVVRAFLDTCEKRGERMTLEQIIEGIKPIDGQAVELAKKKWNSIAKPLHSLGKLEEHIIRMAGITGTIDVKMDKKALIVMCADNGVVEEGVTQTGQEVTAIVAENFLDCNTSAAVMCKKAGVDIYPIDIGMVSDTRVPNYKVAYGTRNMVNEPAMTKEEAMQAVLTGIKLVEARKKEGYQIIATGEMGIGNTTTSSAVASVLLNRPAEVMTGRGAGLTSEGLKRKIQAIEKAIEINHPNAEDALDVLAKVGGFDLAGLAGVYLGGAYYRLPVVIDGFISAVAALAAALLCPASREYMIASHVSKEPGTQMILDELGMSASLTCDMCLGEGTGAVAFLPVLEMALEVYQKMSTFSENNIEDYEELGDK